MHILLHVLWAFVSLTANVSVLILDFLGEDGERDGWCHGLGIQFENQSGGHNGALSQGMLITWKQILHFSGVKDIHVL